MPDRKKKSRKSQKFEDYDVTQAGSDEFEDFDVTKEPEAESDNVTSIEMLGGLSDSEDELNSLVQARDELERRLMPEQAEVASLTADESVSGPGNIVAVGIGENEIGGFPTGQLSLKVLVKEKVKAEHIASEALVPETVGGVGTDVEESGEVYANMFTAQLRPAPCGVSIGNCNRIMAGTLGCLVTRSNQLFILSNNHVIALVNTSPLNAGIPQPGRLDGGNCPNDIIARLTQFIPINFGAGTSNLVDAAIARTSPALVDRRMIRPGGGRQRLVAPIASPVMHRQVQKSGRTTQYRRGRIDLVNTTVNVSFAPLGGVARFTGQFRVRGTQGIFSDRGDSGSVVTTFPENRPIGLLFAGSAASNTTFCNPIRTVLNELGVDIVF